MPPASSRSAAAAAGHARAASSKAAVHLKPSRKSIATDPALLHGSSDEDGEGPQDHEEEHERHTPQVQPAHRASSSKKGKKIGSRSAQASSSTVSSNTTSSPRRSTRLSGEGLGSKQELATAPTSKGARHEHSQSTQTKGTTPSTEISQSMVPSKRKALASSATANGPGSTHPTPPETDSDSPKSRKASASHKKSKNQSQSPTSKTKKLKSASGEPSRPKTRTAASSPPPSDQSDDSDNFAFTRMDQGTSASAPSASKVTAPSESASQPLPNRIAASSSRASSSQPQSKSSKPGITKLESQSAKKASSQTSKSATLLQSLKEVRQDGSRRAGLSDESSAQKPAADPVFDRKGKRKAEESAGDHQETSGLAAVDTAPTSQHSKSTQSEHAKSSTKAKPKKGRVAELSREDLEESQPSQPPDPGTPGRSSMDIPVNTQETPAIKRNLAMRAGLGHGAPPGTPGSARRSSSDMRGRRGSSIGNGLEALPHPSLPSSTLYKHIKADDPPAVRFRTLVTWSAHRLKESSESQSSTASPAVRAAVSSVMDSLIADLVEKRIDLSWQAADPVEDVSSKKLPPNPENEANQAKLESCQAWIKRLQDEDKARNARINQYKAMTERITKLMTPLPPLPASSDPTSSTSLSEIPDLLQPNWTLAIPRFEDRSDMLSYGRKLLEPKPSTISTRRKSAAAAEANKKDNNTTQEDPNIVNVQDEYPIDYDEIRHQAASLAQNSYRINQFLKLADSFVTQHLAKTQASLAQFTTSGGASSSLDSIGSSSNPSTKGKNGHGGQLDHGDAQSTTRALLEGASALHSTGQSHRNRRKGMDTMSLLRAISRADTGKKR